MKAARPGDYFIRLQDPRNPHTLQFWCRDHEAEIVENIEVKVNKKSVATFAIFGKKHADLTALITHLHKKPLKGKVLGKTKKLPINNPIPFPELEESLEDSVDSMLQPRSATVPASAMGGGGGGGGKGEEEFGFPFDDTPAPAGVKVRAESTGAYGFGGSVSGGANAASAAATAAGRSAPGNGNDDSFGGFGDGFVDDDDDDDDDGKGDYLDADVRGADGEYLRSDPNGGGDGGGESKLPAWYAGKLSRDNATRMVESAGPGDFLIRESSRADKCVICVNDDGSILNLMINVTEAGLYQFAGKDLDSLHDVVFMLRQRPLQGKRGNKLLVGEPVPGLATVVAKQQQDQRQAARQAQLRSGRESGMIGFVPDGAVSGVHGSGEDLYSEVTLADGGDGGEDLYMAPGQGSMWDSAGGDGGGEDLYMPPSGFGDGGGGGGGSYDDDDAESIDLLDAYVPNANWIAEYEEKYEASKHGEERLSNDEFMAKREAARTRAATAAKDNAEKMALRAKKSSAWKQHAVVEEEENFHEYQDASAREFGHQAAATDEYDDEDIYDSVPRWFVGAMDRNECNSIVAQASPGSFLVRESSQGNKFVLAVNYQGQTLSFQIVFRKPPGANGKSSTVYEFSGKQHASLELVIDYSVKNAIHKSGEKIPLTVPARD